MKPEKIALSIFIVFGYAGAHATDFVDSAPVMSAEPMVQRVVQQVCQPQTVVTPPQSQGNGIAGAIVGGLAGGLLGSQVGHGNGKTAATIAGAAGGAIVGNQVAGGSSGPTSQTVQSCTNVPHDVVTGYTVVYRYNGRDITTTLPYDPGRYVRVGIGVITEAGGPPHRHREAPMGMPPPPPPGY